jgi:hypothetical protein
MRDDKARDWQRIRLGEEIATVLQVFGATITCQSRP